MDPNHTNNDILNRFEDLDDMFDFIVENFQQCIRDWIVFSKLSIGCEEREVSWEVLRHLIEVEFEDQYSKTFAMIESRKGGNFIVGIYHLKGNDKKYLK